MKNNKGVKYKGKKGKYPLTEKLYKVLKYMKKINVEDVYHGEKKI